MANFNPKEFLSKAPATKNKWQKSDYQGGGASFPAQKQEAAHNAPAYGSSKSTKAHGKGYVSKPKDRWLTSFVLDAEGLKLLLENIPFIQEAYNQASTGRPTLKLKFVGYEHSEEVQEDIKKNGGHATHSVYVRFDDGQQFKGRN